MAHITLLTKAECLRRYRAYDAALDRLYVAFKHKQAGETSGKLDLELQAELICCNVLAGQFHGCGEIL